VRAGGVVTDPDVWRRAIGEVADATAEAGAPTAGVIPSPITGPAGNVEFLLRATIGGSRAHLDVDAAIGAGRELTSA
jgi:23S rRNA (cytidine1920-2'-O)/16S rRNA (cytidine1409-2'-O)-methyltransferase